MNISIAGTGYVGLSNAVLLAQRNKVITLETAPAKVDLTNDRLSPIEHSEIQRYLAPKDLDLRATLDKREAYRDADFVTIATPTDYDPQTNFFNTRSVEEVIEDLLAINPNAVMVIKSTVALGYIKTVREKYRAENSLCLSEFICEGKTLLEVAVYGPALNEQSFYNSRVAADLDEFKSTPGLVGRCERPNLYARFVGSA
ncbi:MULTISPECIES: hypothetical protein [Pseudomonas]|uniref:UDP-glucose/GDP-mannose dehydrogenase N-terminal domain-containing protein n=1 Tax=Serpens gallinarum TaxID=2763075 RepID=A0ABR8TT09_9PSED|nr:MULTISPECIES: hypothetical protein [Pseudomonas]MBD7978910.1 hypothetical protein [Serpens gallinarum]MBF0677208.1 hypothetical protein [Pseudomonas sp.]